MSDLTRFAIFMAISMAVSYGVVSYSLRKRQKLPPAGLLIALTLIVVAGGMVFARYGHLLFQPPWWVYYGFPAAMTIALPPLALRMRGSEAIRYLPLAFLMAPAIHVFFSLLIGWHDYMPFPVYIPSLAEIIRR